ncbi:Uncharacterised protein [uncultured archaeon]|nr:Uncharacterised protein [uncultured archaeon]
MNDACASPSLGACTHGMPSAVNSSFACVIISFVRRDVLAAYFFISSLSSIASASSYFFCASILTSALFCSSLCFSSGTCPSKQNASLMFFCIKLVTLANNPIKWLVTCPLWSVNKVPSLALMLLRNWYSMLFPSTMRILPDSCSSVIGCLIMMSLKLTPILHLGYCYAF